MLKRSITILFAICIFVSFTNCVSTNAKTVSVKEFEGVITYHQVTTSKSGEFDTDDTTRLYYSHGNYVNIHSDKGSSFHLIKDYYLNDKTLRLWLFNNSDTLHQMSLNSPKEKLDDFKIRKISERVLSKACEEINIKTSYQEKDSITYTDFTFIFSRGYLPVNEEHFRNWHLGAFNKVVKESGAFYLKFKAVHFDSTRKNIISTKTYDVISVKDQKVDPNMFEIDKEKIRWYNDQ